MLRCFTQQGGTSIIQLLMNSVLTLKMQVNSGYQA